MKQDIPNTLVDATAAILFPVYGIVDNPLDLTYCGHVTASGNCPTLSVSYMSPRYPPYPNERLAIRAFGITSMSASIGAPSRDSILDKMIEEQSQPVRNPFLWEGTLTIAGILFGGTIQYYASPLRISAFRLKSEKTVLRGHGYGPSCDEVIELLEGLQVLNGRDDVIRQYDNP